MSKKISFIIITFIFVGIGIIYFFQQKVGNILPVLLPTQKNTQTISSRQNTSDTTQINETELIIPQGYSLNIFAKNLGKARDIEVLQSGTILVSLPDKGEVVALQDANNDGKSDKQTIIIENLHNPHGLAFRNQKLFIAEENQVVRYNWNAATQKATQDKVLFDLPKGGRHTSRTLAFDSKNNLYVSIGSTCDVCNEKNERIGIVISDQDGNNPRVFAKGLRNSPFIAINPNTDELWGTEMGRDFLGDNLPPDEVNIIRQGKNYGWPSCYGDKVPDVSYSKENINDMKKLCASTESPIYHIPAHSAPLGLAFDEEGDLLVAYHGSWNSSKPVGYKVVKMNVEGDRITGEEDFITGFLQGSQTIGRPVDVAFDTKKNLYISDDKAGTIYYLYKKE